MKKYMTKKESDRYFGEDNKLKIIKQWEYNGKSYSARRGTDGFIGIVEDKNYFTVGNAGIDFCFEEDEIDDLARKLGVMA